MEGDLLLLSEGDGGGMVEDGHEDKEEDGNRSPAGWGDLGDENDNIYLLNHTALCVTILCDENE